MSTTIERVTFRPEGAKRSRTIILDQVVVTPMFLTGIEVGPDGDEIAPAGVDERRHIISTELVSRRVPMVMDNHYAMLVPADA